MLPKTQKEQRAENKIKGKISIKITKPRMTIDGFKVDKPKI
jgi:hypothetical protein